MDQPIRVLIKCPACGWRLMDKVTPTQGKIKTKCPRCHKVVEGDLSQRKAGLRYRMSSGERSILPLVK